MAATSWRRSAAWVAGGLPLGAFIGYLALWVGVWGSYDRMTPGYLGLSTLLVLGVGAVLWRWAPRPLAVSLCATALVTLTFVAWLAITVADSDL